MHIENKPIADALQQDPSLLQNIQSEVTTETRPLLQFIVRYARFIVAGVVALILALAGTGIYRYIITSQQTEMQDALAKIELGKADAEQAKKIEALIASSAERLHPALYAALAQNGILRGDYALAGKAYATVARMQADSPMGLAAALNEAGCLLHQEKYAEAVQLLQGLEARLPKEAEQVRVMLAEAAFRAGQLELAASTFDALAANVSGGVQNHFYTARAKDIRAQAKAK